MPIMEETTTPQKSPSKIKVKKGKTYSWCVCGLSIKQPFCDGAHRKEGKFRSLKYTATEDQDIFFCVCKKTKKSPFCDGSHSKP